MTHPWQDVYTPTMYFSSGCSLNTNFNHMAEGKSRVMPEKMLTVNVKCRVINLYIGDRLDPQSRVYEMSSCTQVYESSSVSFKMS